MELKKLKKMLKTKFFHKKFYSGVFGVADHESAVKVKMFLTQDGESKMAD